MSQLATITSKRQLTIPIAIFEELGLKEGDRVLVKKEANKMTIQPAKILVKELAGSVTLPKKYQGMPIEKVIRLAKEDYFKEKK
jgi:AbrB family looped-hinge helix DNA binding protein